ncbi:HMG box domain containing protein [Asbolus verrucosus]|uniref:HMG box domain containing protein n=1 Tax=Asbolus verrucosus TaxID=1661398 RepID=A0A482VBU8_ASBVE|nr:HMG box domain containing protein [Asbolus verrucosus]
MNNAYVKTHNSFLPEAQPPRNLLLSDKSNQVTENNNQTIQEVWAKYKFDTNNVAVETAVNNLKMSWATENSTEKEAEEEVKVEEEEESASPKEKEEETSPSHHARRPMNAFLIFCKKHRPIVRERFPNLENRGVTRILGEWWALLDENDKAPYTGLAKEYKDAFLSANPNFKWYKLPAPPLRTLNVRPTSTHKVQSPVSSPTHNFSMESEFTPGKLADESQLGGLTSLMNNNFSPSKIVKSNENNNNIEKNGDQTYDSSLQSPVNLIKTSLPPKPFKKRTFEKYPDNKNVSRNILLTDISAPEEHDHDGSNMTNQDLMDKVVDKIFTQPDHDYDTNGLRKEVRKSGRQCKGKRYEKFMVEGRLLGNKRDTKLTSQKIENELNIKLETKPELETPNLDHTIKRLAERTNMKNVLENQKDEEKNDRIRSATHDSNTNFDLNLRINNLPSLSYDVFHQRKKESKKRKNRIRTDSESKSKVAKLAKSDAQPVGSKKRKNKHSITHLKEENSIGGDLLALATLAEVAANTEKINSE